jgi:hypothetical protein
MMLALFLAGVMLQGKLMIEMTCLFQYVMLLSSALSVQSSPIFIVVEDVSIGGFSLVLLVSTVRQLVMAK